MWFSTIVWSID